MTRREPLLITLALGLSAVAAVAAAQSELPLLPPNAQTGGVTTRAAAVLGTRDVASGLAIKVRFDLPQAYFWYDAPALTDASAYDGVYFKVKNLGTKQADFTVELHNPLPGGGSGKFLTGIHVRPGEEQRVTLWFDDEAPPSRPFTFFPAATPEPSQTWTGGTWNFDRTKVAGFLMWNTTPDGATVEIQDLKLVKKRRSFAGAIDPYGQYAFYDWSGKVSSDADLLRAKTDEAALLATQSDVLSPDTTNAFGSSAPSAKWRFEKAPSGNWFAVNPAGRRTWMVGVNNLSAESSTMVSGRESLFQNTPVRTEANANLWFFAPNDPTGFWGWVFNYYGSNLTKKYGSDFKPAWAARTLDRLRKWGVNMGVSPVDPSLRAAGLPYAQNVFISGYPTKLNVPAVAWWAPNDPYAPDFRSWVARQIRRDAGALLAGEGNPVGLTLGNEETWGWVGNDSTKYQIPIAALNAPATQPGKAPMLGLLKRRYGNNARRLAMAWRKNWTSWAPLEGTNALTFDNNLPPAMKADLSALLGAWARQYYAQLKGAIADSGYTGAWLGTRDSMDLTPDEVFDAQTRYVDAVTINLYNIQDANWARVERLAKPVILSEFSYSAIDRGLSTPDKRFEANDQGDRARLVRAYLDKAAGTKNVVGAWFYQYVDELATGRQSDDERMNLGLVDVTDTPYPEVTAAFRDFGLSLPQRRRLR